MANVSGTLLKKARLAADLTQKELADAVEGISPQDISKAERGIADLTPEQLNAVADVLGTTTEELTASEDTGASAEDTLSDIAAEEVSVPEDSQEEAATADLLLLVLDASDPNAESQYETVCDVLSSIC